MGVTKATSTTTTTQTTTTTTTTEAVPNEPTTEVYLVYPDGDDEFNANTPPQPSRSNYDESVDPANSVDSDSFDRDPAYPTADPATNKPASQPSVYDEPKYEDSYETYGSGDYDSDDEDEEALPRSARHKFFQNEDEWLDAINENEMDLIYRS